MHKEDIKREIEKIKKEASIYGWNDHKTREYERLEKEWEKCSHTDQNGKQTKAPEI